MNERCVCGGFIVGFDMQFLQATCACSLSSRAGKHGTCATLGRGWQEGQVPAGSACRRRAPSSASSSRFSCSACSRLFASASVLCCRASAFCFARSLLITEKICSPPLVHAECGSQHQHAIKSIKVCTRYEQRNSVEMRRQLECPRKCCHYC